MGLIGFGIPCLLLWIARLRAGGADYLRPPATEGENGSSAARAAMHDEWQLRLRRVKNPHGGMGGVRTGGGDRRQDPLFPVLPARNVEKSGTANADLFWIE